MLIGIGCLRAFAEITKGALGGCKVSPGRCHRPNMAGKSTDGIDDTQVS
jgi:hypothetical protein